MPYWRLSAYYFWYFAFLGAFAPYFGLYLQARGLSAWQIAVLLSQMQLMRIVAPVAWGWVADHSGRPLLIVRFSALLSLLGMAAFLLAESMVGWLAALAVMAFFWSAALPLVEGFTLAALGALAGRYTRVRLWGSVGFIATVLAVGALVEATSLAWVPPALVALLALLLATALWLPGDRRPPAGEAPARLGGVLRQPRVARMLIACFCMSMAHGALYVFYSIHLAASGHSPSLIGLLWSLGVIAEIAVFLWGGRFLHWRSPRVLLAICLAAAVLRFLLVGWGVGSLPLLLAAQLLHGLTFGAFHAVSVAAIHRWFPAGGMGRGQALYSSVSFGAGGFVGGLASGALWDAWGGALTFTVSALFAMGGFAAVGGASLLRRPRRPASRAG
jgi:PPP family 3-phenylpropionic acid transporter